MTDLYEYPRDHVGTRHYVSVRGYARSIPRYKTFKGSDGYNYLLPEFGGVTSPCAGGGPYYMPDKAPYQSPLDGTMVTSRSQHREHMKRHDVIEAGDMPRGSLKPSEGRRITGVEIVRAIRQLESR